MWFLIKKTNYNLMVITGLLVEVTGLEPAASCSQSRHSSQTELHLGIYNAVCTADFIYVKLPKECYAGAITLNA